MTQPIRLCLWLAFRQNVGADGSKPTQSESPACGRFIARSVCRPLARTGDPPRTLLVSQRRESGGTRRESSNFYVGLASHVVSW